MSVFADPSGAFTTAAALVACVEKELKEKHGKNLQDSQVLVFGGTGPVGIATGIIASLAGAGTILVDHLSVEAATDIARAYNRRFGCNLSGACASTEIEKTQLITKAEVIFCTAKAGVQVLSATVLKEATQLKVVGDVNAVPPAGIAGVDAFHNGTPIEGSKSGAVGIGALAIWRNVSAKSKLETKSVLTLPGLIVPGQRMSSGVRADS